MGTWDVTSFGNDDAVDWIFDLVDNGVDAIIDALEGITESEAEYLDVADCSVAVAAAEVVATSLGVAGDDVPDEVVDWLKKSGFTADKRLARMALDALERIRTDSELKEIWDEVEDSDEDFGGDSEEWYEALSDLESRLQMD